MASKTATVAKGTTLSSIHKLRPPQVLPEKNDLTLKMIRDQIPPHYFKQHTGKSMYYLARDLVQIAVTAAVWLYWGIPALSAVDAAIGAESSTAAWGFSAIIKLIAWNVFWFVQGLNFTAVWVLAHECGHQGFSPYRTVNDTVGWFFHSALLVPYHSWRISHGNHHKHTNHTTLDTVFVPSKRVPAPTSPLKEAVEESPLATTFGVVLMLTFGWPMYLLFNTAGQKYARRTNHFEPASPLFRAPDKVDVLVSDVGIVAVLAALAYASYLYTPMAVFCWYWAPYIWTHAWLVGITFMQHSDVRLPHYAAEEWNFVRGAMATVDRDFGFPINAWLHHINDSHVVHHLFSTMPFYNAIKVTREHIPRIFPEREKLYLTDNRPIWTMMAESWRNCQYINPAEPIALFKSS